MTNEKPLLQCVADFLFLMRPKEKRYIPSWLEKSFTTKKNDTEHYDDVYLYYLLLRTSLVVALLLLALNVASRVYITKFNLYFFTIDSTADDYVKAFLGSYPKYSSAILIFMVLPYYCIMKRYNSTSMTRVSNVIGLSLPPGLRSPWKFYPAFALGFCFIGLGEYMASDWFRFYMGQNHLENSDGYFFFSGLSLTPLMALVNMFFLMGITRFLALKKIRSSIVNDGSLTGVQLKNFRGAK